MLYDLSAAVFKDGNSEKMVLDTHIPKDGVYIRINQDGGLFHLIVDKDTEKTSEIFHWFQTADYYGSYLNSNKSVGTKRIHSSHYLAVFAKYETIIKEGVLLDSFMDELDKYYGALLAAKDEESILKEYGIPQKEEQLILDGKRIITEYIPEIVVRIVGLEKVDEKAYIKIFVEAEMQVYMHEYLRYAIPRIFNKNDFNIQLENVTYGLSDSNMGMNSKKPYLEHKTANYRVPYRVTRKEAGDFKHLLEWLTAQKDEAGKSINQGYIPIPIDQMNQNADGKSFEHDNSNGQVYALKATPEEKTSNYFIYFNRGTETIIKDFDVLPEIQDKIESFQWTNYLLLETFEEKWISNRGFFMKVVDENFYNGRLRAFFQTRETPKVNQTEFSKKQVNLVVLSGEAWYLYFKKGYAQSLLSIVDDITYRSMIERLSNKSCGRHRLGTMLNLRFAILRYFKIGGKEYMGDRIKEMYEELLQKILSDEICYCGNVEEFYFAAGQFVYYLVSQTRAQDPKYNTLDPFLNAVTAGRLKYELEGVFRKYNHAVSIGNPRFQNLLGMIEGYDVDAKSKVMYDLFLAGFATKNVMYFKCESKGGTSNENEK